MIAKNGLIGAAILLLGGLGATTHAQDYHRRVPTNAFQVRLGYYLPGGGGTVWEDAEQRFTHSAEDFSGAVWGVSFVGAINPSFEFGVNADWYQRTVRSAEQFYVDQDGYPIVHDTTFRQVPLAVDLRLVPGGRRPGRPVFYLGAGAGLTLWEYSEIGDFVDEGDPTLPIYFGAFYERGESLEGRVLAGLEFPVSPAFNLTFEGRYSFAETELRGDLAGLGSLDRGGAWLFGGASFRF